MASKHTCRTLIGTLAALVATPLFAADPGKLTVKVDQPGAKISPMLYGLMTEEINHSYDGGLYAELIQNRTFQDAKTPVHWSLETTNGAQAKMTLDNAAPINDTALTTALRIDITDTGNNGVVRVVNDGFWGIPVKPKTDYQISYFAKTSTDFGGEFMVGLKTSNGTTYLGLPVPPTQWKKYATTLNAQALNDANGRFYIQASGKGSLWLNLVSLMPPTYNNRPNGNRPDLMQKLADLQPAFLRLPGGNYLEGNTIAERFNWKATIGPLEDRPGHQCPWGYRSSDGLGLLEYLDWCEDLKMKPVLAVFAGYALQGQVVTGNALQPHVQDALDELEYVTGDASTKWGAQRAKDGHPAPFKLTYVEIGNEDNFDRSNSYSSRYAQFYNAIKPKYPNLQLIATTPIRGMKPDVLDDHYYRSALAMENDAHHYDKADRNGPKIFVGEWATTEGNPTPTMNAALGDAAWLTGLERNSDLVVMSCYAPLLVNRNAAQWPTNLIGYDALKSFGSPSYYVQRMFNQNRGDTVLPVELVPQIAKAALEVPAPHGAVGVGTWATNAEYKDIKVTKPDGALLYQSDFTKGSDGWKLSNGDWKAENEALHQSGNATDCRAIVTDQAAANWGDCNYTLQARKLGGSEGFLILFNVKDSDNYTWFNIGGWANTRTAIEVAESGAKRTIGNESNATVENNRWYDIRIETRGKTVTCFIDGKQIATAIYTPLPQADPLYATASRDDATGDVIVKVVNVQAAPQRLELNLQGLATVNATASLEVLTGDPSWVNTINEPEKVAPKKTTLAAVTPKFVQEFPGYSTNVLRFKTK